MNIEKVQFAARSHVGVGGETIEPSAIAEVVGEREIGMLGAEPNPALFYWIALSGSSGAPLRTLWSDGSGWHEAKNLDEAKKESGWVAPKAKPAPKAKG